MSIESEPSDPNSSLRDYVRVLFRQKVIIFISVVIVTPIVMVSTMLRTPVYEASVKMLISGQKQVDSLFYKDLMAMQDAEVAQTQSEIVTSDPVLRRVVEALKLYNKPANYEYDFATPLKRKLLTLQARMHKIQISRMSEAQQSSLNYQRAISELRASIKVEPIRGTSLFTINVKDFDPVGATVVANVVSRAYVIFDLEQQLAELEQKYGEKHPMVMQMQNNIKQMSELLSGRPMTNQEALGSASVKIIEQATVPYAPTGGGKGKFIVLAAFFASIFMGFILAFLFEYMDQTIKSPGDAERVLGLPLFGTIPVIRPMRRILMTRNAKKMLVNRDIQRMPKRYNAIFQNLANQLRLMVTVKSFKTVMVTSVGAREGTSSITANLAVYAAHGGSKKVLVIDANFHRPLMHRMFNVPDSPGFVDVLTGQATLEHAIKSVQPTLFVLPAGKTTFNPLIFLDTPKTRELLEKLKSQFDLILIDCVDLSSTQEGCLLAPWVDKTILVIAENQTRRPVALKVLAHLKEHHASILGAILNKRTYPIPRFIYNRV